MRQQTGSLVAGNKVKMCPLIIITGIGSSSSTSRIEASSLAEPSLALRQHNSQLQTRERERQEN